jgi:predicted GH43/DUF377 family glycosyl hydrolase
MITRLSSKCLLRPEHFKPSQDDLEVIGAFNPGAVQTNDGGVVLLVRIAEQAKEKRMGHTALPRWDIRGKRVMLDWVQDTEISPVDVRVVRSRKNGLVRLTFTSHLLVVVRSRDGRNIYSIEDARLLPETQYEQFGVEDPRITRIGNSYYITYVAVSCHGVATALASTKDFQTFPERIGEFYYALHRPNAASPFTRPEMWLATSPDLAHWGNHEQFLGGGELWDVGRIGGGTPPMRTAGGWLEIYHGNSRKEEDAGIGTYSAGVLLLDIENPKHIIGRSGQIFVPELDYEIEGFVPNVVFPAGIVQQEDRLLVYYGAADTFSGLVEFSLKELLSAVAKK